MALSVLWPHVDFILLENVLYEIETMEEMTTLSKLMYILNKYLNLLSVDTSSFP